MKRYAILALSLMLLAAGAEIFNWGLHNSMPESTACTPLTMLFLGGPVCGWSDFAYFGSRVAIAAGLVLALVVLVTHRRDRQKHATQTAAG